MSYADDSAAEKHAQEANHYHPTPWLRKWALVETGTFIQSPLRGDTALRLPAEWPTAAASCNHVPVTMDDLSGGVLHSWMVGGKKETGLALSNNMRTALSACFDVIKIKSITCHRFLTFHIQNHRIICRCVHMWISFNLPLDYNPLESPWHNTWLCCCPQCF